MLSVRKVVSLLIVITVMLTLPGLGQSNTSAKKKENKIPNYVLEISKENTFPNSVEDQEIVEQSEFTKELIKDLPYAIDNPNLIKMLNQTSLSPSKTAIGYRGMIYLGNWALNYKSSDTIVNWEYEKINLNEQFNGSDETQKLRYVQKEQKEMKAALTNQIDFNNDVQKMMLLEAKNKLKLPLAQKAVFGKDTKTDNSYEVPTEKKGHLQAYGAAVNEKGEVTFGEVYLELKGSKKQLVVKNVTKQGIGAWIPIQDHVSFSYQLK